MRTDYNHVTYDDWFDVYCILLAWRMWHWQKYRRMHNL
jgi:hypothetical protein